MGTYVNLSPALMSQVSPTLAGQLNAYNWGMSAVAQSSQSKANDHNNLSRSSFVSEPPQNQAQQQQLGLDGLPVGGSAVSRNKERMTDSLMAKPSDESSDNKAGDLSELTKEEDSIWARANAFAARPDALNHLMELSKKLVAIPSSQWFDMPHNELYAKINAITGRHDFITGPLAIPFFELFLPIDTSPLGFGAYFDFTTPPGETRDRNVLRKEFTVNDIPALERIAAREDFWASHEISRVLMTNIAEVAKHLAKEHPRETFSLRLQLLTMNTRYGNHDEILYEVVYTFKTDEDRQALQALANDPRLAFIPETIESDGQHYTAAEVVARAKSFGTFDWIRPRGGPDMRQVIQAPAPINIAMITKPQAIQMVGNVFNVFELGIGRVTPKGISFYQVRGVDALASAFGSVNAGIIRAAYEAQKILDGEYDNILWAV